jgi:peptidoglycan L-alanyl-D-glutamate endopeptidase CwlK
MGITLGNRSLDRLEGVHPSIVKVVKRAAQMATPDEDFTVLEGVRSKEQMCINYGKGRTVAECLAKGVPARYSEPGKAKVTWLSNPFNSMHRVHDDGFGHAVDLAPYPIDWDDFGRFRKLMDLMKHASAECGVSIVCGGDWTRADYPHYETAL